MCDYSKRTAQKQMPNVILNVRGASLKEIVNNLRDASFHYGLRHASRTLQHDKTGTFILWLTLTLQFLLSSSLNFVKNSTIIKKLLLHTIPTPQTTNSIKLGNLRKLTLHLLRYSRINRSKTDLSKLTLGFRRKQKLHKSFRYLTSTAFINILINHSHRSIYRNINYISCRINFML